MARKAGNAMSDWDLCACYDWSSPTSWRALIATAAAIGLMCAVAALIAESIVRDGLGMELGRTAFGGPELLVIGVAVGIIIPCQLIWCRVLRSPDGNLGDAPMDVAKQDGVSRELAVWFLAPVWAVFAMATAIVLYACGYKLIGAANSVQHIVVVFFVPILGMGGASLHAGLRRLGAKPVPSGPLEH